MLEEAFMPLDAMSDTEVEAESSRNYHQLITSQQHTHRGHGSRQ
jgi:hypothetical protein